MSVYLIVEAKEVLDKTTYGEYIQKVPATVEKFGGKYLARGGEAQTLSGDWNPERIVIVSFGSIQNFKTWWNSPEYRGLAPLRERSAKTNAILVQGV